MRRLWTLRQCGKSLFFSLIPASAVFDWDGLGVVFIFGKTDREKKCQDLFQIEFICFQIASVSTKMDTRLIMILIVAGVLFLIYKEETFSKHNERKMSKKQKSIARGSGGNGPFSEEEKKRGLALMNELRCSVGADGKLPYAQSMKKLIWDPKLEQRAQAFANTCPQNHNPKNAGDKVGENLAGGFPSLSLEDAVRLWDDERNLIDLNEVQKSKFKFTASQTPKWCKGGWSQCGHLTQQLWANTTHVGCARSAQPCGAFNVVCNYSPAGNMVNQEVYPVSAAKTTTCQ